jgi:hypothetical protein
MIADPRAERLERSYRRLLACYPAHYRAVYGEEMIGVLMMASTPHQRRPDGREAVGLLASGLRARLRLTSQASPSPAWRSAAGSFGYLAAASLAAMYLYSVTAGAWVVDPTGTIVWYIPLTALTVPVAWALAAVAAGLGWRLIAAAGATVATVGQTVMVAGVYVENPADLVAQWWRLVLAVAAAAALTTVIRPAAAGDRAHPLGVRARIAVGVAAILAGAAPAIEALTVIVTPMGPSGFSETYWGPLGSFGLPWMDHRPLASLAALVVMIALAIVVVRLSPAVRRRVVVLTLPAAVTALVVTLTFGGFMASSPRFIPPVYLIGPQWVSLMAVPVLAFVGGTWLVARYERKLASGALLA